MFKGVNPGMKKKLPKKNLKYSSIGGAQSFCLKNS
jgi:hypothetical protein